MSIDNIRIRQLTEEDTIPYELLLLADPSEVRISTYFKKDMAYVAEKDYKELVGVVVMKKIENKGVEIKNIAVKPTMQGLGLGKKLLSYAIGLAQGLNYKTLRVGTGNSSIGQLALYQKVGFEIVGIEQNFFVNNYDGPIIENGIQCKHLIVLEKDLNYSWIFL